jgi:hypothetical protein
VRNNERYLAFSPAVSSAFLEISDLRIQSGSVYLQYIERVEIDVSLVRLELNTIRTYGTIHCEVANSFPPDGLARVSDGATLKPQTACHRRTAKFWNVVEARIAQSATGDL